eukprot:CAMPEP_0202828462 /NCGR_PEP_ID=MMETSP1389-20130828/14942_1 /ASSEMBLY_ACC=CAM_ASM_000865 /TAXON_ID=302021 /ORGANISM="Rhodomonas sp., Strain CCMP768" /LENGTH=134 /DNA_ID=CAMNT_0049501951 /DNA_START=45 /DNA_END=449 /DNA_ORIENTATION=+
MLAALLVMADNVRHVLQDTGVWPPGPWPGSSQYVGDCNVRQPLLEYPKRECASTEDCVDGGVCTQDGALAGICTENAETIACLSAVGWAFTVVATYLGFFLLFVGSAWNANLLGKLAAIRSKWRALRGSSAKTR